MKNTAIKIFCKSFLLICILQFSGNNIFAQTLPPPKIANAVAELSGTVDPRVLDASESIYLFVSVYGIVSGESYGYELEPDENGAFVLNIPMETDIAFATLTVDIEKPSKIILLNSGGSNVLTIAINENDEIDVTMSEGDTPLSDYDIMNAGDVFMYTVLSNDIDTDPDYKAYKGTPLQYINFLYEIVNKKSEKFINRNLYLSSEMKDYLCREFKLYMFNNAAFDYQGNMISSYIRNNSIEEAKGYTPATPDLSYYFFLKNLDLNSPQNLYCINGYRLLLINILENGTINLPKIGGTPISAWIKEASLILGDLVGFEGGLFYDMLAVQSYVMQFEQTKPLTEQQKQNITAYFDNEAIVEILFRENERTERLASRHSLPVVHATPEVSDEDLLCAIVSGYAGHPVVVDFWATWCGPCLSAMSEMREIKGDYFDKGVVFVYITNPSSPEKLWEEKIVGIGGEHYYISSEQWSYIMKSIESTGIPTYLFFNADGELVNTMVGYGGLDSIKRNIDLLVE